MSVIVILIICSLIVALVFLVAFVWAANSGQFDDTHGPSVRMLLDNNSKSSGRKHANPERRKSEQDKVVFDSGSGENKG